VEGIDRFSLLIIRFRGNIFSCSWVTCRQGEDGAYSCNFSLQMHKIYLPFSWCWS